MPVDGCKKEEGEGGSLPTLSFARGRHFIWSLFYSWTELHDCLLYLNFFHYGQILCVFEHMFSVLLCIHIVGIETFGLHGLI